VTAGGTVGTVTVGSGGGGAGAGTFTTGSTIACTVSPTVSTTVPAVSATVLTVSVTVSVTVLTTVVAVSTTPPTTVSNNPLLTLPSRIWRYILHPQTNRQGGMSSDCNAFESSSSPVARATWPILCSSPARTFVRCKRMSMMSKRSGRRSPVSSSSTGCTLLAIRYLLSSPVSERAA
jgi:hypothetical protein